MIKVIDLQGCGFLENRKFKNKTDLRNTMLCFAKNENLAKETDLRDLTLNNLLDIWNLDIQETEEFNNYLNKMLEIAHSNIK